MRIKNLKRRVNIWILLISSSLFLTGITQAGERLNFIQRFGIRVSSGFSYLNVGDINTHLESGNEMHIDYAQYFNGVKKGELRKIRHGFDSEVELTFDITSRLRIGLGTGYVYGRRKSSSSFEVSPPGFYDVDFTFSPKISISAVPIKLGVYYVLPFSSKAKLFINGGIGYYFAKTNFYWKQREIWTEDGSLIVDIRKMVEWDLSSKGSGYHGGIGFEYNLTRNLTLVIEVQRRYARIKKLKGDEIYVGSGYSEQNYYGAMYYLEKKDPITDKYYSYLGFFKEKPDNPEYRNIRDAELDLSGYFFKIGIRIRLF